MGGHGASPARAAARRCSPTRWPRSRATAVTVTRPAQAALVPALARTPDELTATNVVSGWIESMSVLVAPALRRRAARRRLSGLGVRRDGGVVAAASALSSRRSHGPAPACDARPALRRRSPASACSRASRRHGLLVGLLGAQFVAIGALDVLYVVLAISVLDLGGSGAGYLNAAFGAGGVPGSR